MTEAEKREIIEAIERVIVPRLIVWGVRGFQGVAGEEIFAGIAPLIEKMLNNRSVVNFNYAAPPY